MTALDDPVLDVLADLHKTVMRAGKARLDGKTEKVLEEIDRAIDGAMVAAELVRHEATQAPA